MIMYSYKFNDSLKPIETFIGDTVPQGFIAFNDGSPVDWTKFNYINSELVAVIVPTPPEPYVPTPEEIKAQALQSLDYEYQRQSKELSESWLTATISGNTDMALEIAEEKSLLTQEYAIKRGNIK